MKSYISSINTTIQKFYKSNNETSWIRIKSVDPGAKFTKEINSLYAELTRNVRNRDLNTTRLTVFLWDNTTMIEHIKTLLTATLNTSMSRRLEQIIEAIRNHIVKIHYSTHSIYSNNMRIDSLAKGKTLRFSRIDLENVLVQFFETLFSVINLFYKIELFRICKLSRNNP